MPEDYLTIKTGLPNQEILVEAQKSNNWPPPTLAAIKDNNMKILNNTKTPILLDGKQTVSETHSHILHKYS